MAIQKGHEVNERKDAKKYETAEGYSHAEGHFDFGDRKRTGDQPTIEGHPKTNKLKDKASYNPDGSHCP
jgi:murein L,D-transpeptidase YafK